MTSSKRTPPMPTLLAEDLAEIRRWLDINLMNWLVPRLDRIEEAVAEHVPGSGLSDRRDGGHTESSPGHNGNRAGSPVAESSIVLVDSRKAA